MKRKKLQFSKKTQHKDKNVRLPSMLMYPAGIDDGCTAWRFDWVRLGLNYSKKAQCQMTTVVQPLFVDHPSGQKALSPLYKQVDAVVQQRPVFPEQIQKAMLYQQIQKKIKSIGRKPFRFIIDVDDVVHADHIADFNVAKKGYADNSRFRNFSEVVKRSDELHVCSTTMADFYKEHIGFENVLHRPNLMPRFLFDVFYNKDIIRQRYEKHKDKPRILWAGSWTHMDVGKNDKEDDFTKLEKFVKSTLDKYQWVFVGAHPIWLESEIREGKVEYHSWVSIMDYPRTIWNLEPTIIFAPLADNVFNRCKSNIKFTEAGAFGIAGVFQDLDPYKEAPLRFNTADELGDHFDFLLNSWENYDKIATEMRATAENYFIETSENMNLLHASYFTDVGSPEREFISKKLIDIQ